MKNSAEKKCALTLKITQRIYEHKSVEDFTFAREAILRKSFSLPSPQLRDLG